jgi:YggT family protein
MTEPQPFTPDEPAAPQRGQTRDELGRDVSEAQAESEAEESTFKSALKTMHPRFFFSMADGYPVVLKQFIQFCLLIVYPAWLFTVPFGLVVYYVGYAIIYPPLWLLFLPVRMYQKKYHPEEYAANRAKYAKKKKK